MRTRDLDTSTQPALPMAACLRVRWRLSAIVLLSYPFLFISCGDGGGTGPKVEPVARVVVSPSKETIETGQSLQLTATARDAAGRELSGRAITWASSDDAVATVNGTGLVTGVEAGSPTITATCEGKSGTATITVTPDLGTVFGAEQFVQISAGTFQMGDITGHGNPNELPVHTVNITQPFYMQVTEVTQEQWRAVTGDDPSEFNSCGETCPVENVSWHDIQRFLDTLNAKDPGKNYRLPTEAEWEYAARAGATGDYAGTGVLDDMGWHAGNSGSTSHPAAEKQPNAWGLYDMHGNVWEWVQDRYASDYYAVSPTDDPQGPATGTLRVLRGGGWGSHVLAARSAFRDNNDYPSSRNPDNGFRLVRNAPGT